MKYGFDFSKPQYNATLTGIYLFRQPKREIFLALAFLGYEIAFGRFESREEQSNE